MGDRMSAGGAWILWNQMPYWLWGHQVATIPESEMPKAENKDDYSAAHVASDDIEAAHIILSDDGEGVHRPVLDIDFPVHVVPSSTPGHFHLYLDKQMAAPAYMRLLDALAEAGIIEPGYAKVSNARGYTSVRLPWIKKPEPQT